MRFRYKLDMVVILEPRVSGMQANRIIKNWGFKHSIRREAEGFSGGIWLLWELDDLIVDVRLMEDQFIHCCLRLGGKQMFFTAVYASPNESRRQRTWDMLLDIANEIREPWLLGGDFNEIKTPMEQKGGASLREARCRRFKEWIEGCNLIDLEAQGPFFTWKGPKWDGLDRVYKRLDRCLCNVQWQEMFENAEIKVIPRLCSDHHPIMVNLKVENKRGRGRNFRYQVAWQLHEQYEELIKHHWQRNEELHEKLSSLQQQLVCWNRDVFGRIEYRKRRLLNRLEGIQKSMDRRKSRYYRSLVGG
ncbi:hypothetical protein K1719_042018 [Acacia pycnantha]|nr:hypothetical protein K1719_042018 [Acacia pycnantha]